MQGFDLYTEFTLYSLKLTIEKTQNPGLSSQGGQHTLIRKNV